MDRRHDSQRRQQAEGGGLVSVANQSDGDEYDPPPQGQVPVRPDIPPEPNHHGNRSYELPNQSRR